MHILPTAHHYYSGDHIENNKMGGEYSTYWGEERAYIVLVGNLRERDHLEDTDSDGTVV
jgi:hypothetical protein